MKKPTRTEKARQYERLAKKATSTSASFDSIGILLSLVFAVLAWNVVPDSSGGDTQTIIKGIAAFGGMVLGATCELLLSLYFERKAGRYKKLAEQCEFKITHKMPLELYWYRLLRGLSLKPGDYPLEDQDLLVELLQLEDSKLKDGLYDESEYLDACYRQMSQALSQLSIQRL